LVIAPAFSLWWNDPPFESLHEMARTAEVATRLAKEIATIPTLVWRTLKDMFSTTFSATPALVPRSSVDRAPVS
jgi:hypothetical protein